MIIAHVIAHSSAREWAVSALSITGACLAAERRHRPPGRARDEREWIVAELRRSTRPGGAARTLGATTAERARKAVSAPIRDAIRRIAEIMPDLGAHLDRSVRTGTTCRYDP